MSNEDLESEYFTESTGETDIDDTETVTGSETNTTETQGTTDDTEETLASFSEHSTDKKIPLDHQSPQDILSLKGRHIRAEDFEWAQGPVPTLAEIVGESSGDIKSTELEKYLKNANSEQIPRILELLPLDLPLDVTLPLLEDGTYWKRKCLENWSACEVWRYSDNWKSMFVHCSVQGMIENFSPNTDYIWDLCKSLRVFSNYVTSLKILKLVKAVEENVSIDLFSDNFDEHLDDVLSAPHTSTYLDFAKVFECFPRLCELSILLSPKSIDMEEFCFNISDFNCLFRGLYKLNDLRKFWISNAVLKNEHITVILKMFTAHKNLTQLNLSYNLIDDATCDYLAKLLISDCPLEFMVLQRNKISDEGTKSIASALSVNSRLKTLNLSFNLIGDKGGSFLAKVLLSNRSLTYLDISNNQLTPSAGIYFAELVKKSECLRNLKLQKNFLGKATGKLFVDAIKENHTLLELDVNFCGFISDDEGSIYQFILRNRTTVPYLEYSKNFNDCRAAEFLF